MVLIKIYRILKWNAKKLVTNSFIFYLCFDKERYLHKKTYKFGKTYQNQFSQIFWQAKAEQLTKYKHTYNEKESFLLFFKFYYLTDIWNLNHRIV